jgi:hypothetical protein
MRATPTVRIVDRTGFEFRTVILGTELTVALNLDIFSVLYFETCGVTVIIPSSILDMVLDSSTLFTSKRYRPGLILAVLLAGKDIVTSPCSAFVIWHMILAVAFAE